MTVTVSVTTKVEFKPWQTPNYVLHAGPLGRREDGLQPLPTTPLKEVDQSVLDALAGRWLEEVYEKAGKRSPWIKRVTR